MSNHFLKKVSRKAKKYISRFRILKFRTNLLAMFSLYSVLLLITLLLYGYFNLNNVLNYKKHGDINFVSWKVRNIASNIETAKETQLIKEEILKSEILTDGDYILVDFNGNVVFSNYRSGNGPLNLRKDLLKKLGDSSETTGGYYFENGKEYTFYEKITSRNLILFYIIPKSHFESYYFPIVNFILFSSGLCLFVYFVIIQRFKNKVYYPIVNVEKVIHGLVEGDTDFAVSSIKEDNALYPLYSDLNTMINRVKDLILREYNANIMKKQAELDALQSQINPHFLYNTLESIRGQAITKGMDDIEIMTKALSDLFRYSVSRKGNLVSLEEELRNIDNYLLIQQYRFNNKFIVVHKVEQDTLECKIPKLLIQPIVENAIYHGLETKIGKGNITIKAYRTMKRLVVNIQDDGLGISHDKLVEINKILVNGKAEIKTKGSSLKIGLINVNERIKLNFGDDYGLRVYSSKGVGTNVEIVLPLLNGENNFSGFNTPNM